MKKQRKKKKYAGFASPAQDFSERSLDLNQLLIKHPAATFFARVKGGDPQSVTAKEGDILVVDRSRDLKDGDIALLVVSGEMVLRRVHLKNHTICLSRLNGSDHVSRIDRDGDFEVWGVVTHIIQKC